MTAEPWGNLGHRPRAVPLDNSAARTAALQRPAIERMEQAEAWLEDRRRRGYRPEVEWLPRIRLVSGGNTLFHPVGILLELLWLLRDQAPAAKRQEPPEAARYYGGGGWNGRAG